MLLLYFIAIVHVHVHVYVQHMFLQTKDVKNLIFYYYPSEMSRDVTKMLVVHVLT